MRSSLCSIVPPHILRHLAESDDPALRRRAHDTLAIAERLRSQRLTAGPGIIPRRTFAARRCMVYDAMHGSALPGVLVRAEDGDASTDLAAERAFIGAADTYDFYRSAYNRVSIDSRGMEIDSTVHYAVRFDNAFWNGQQMVYGDGDGVLFRDFTSCLDVIGHELTHGVTQYEAGLNYHDQPGALNESISDVFGVLVKQWRLRQSAKDADWLVGSGLLGATVRGVALRSMKAPGTAYDDPRLGRDPQPAHLSDYVQTRDDDGGVHINSGIPNHAFYVCASELGGFAWERAGAIWFQALTRYLRPEATFGVAATATAAAAATLFGHDSLEVQAVKVGWREVGVEADQLIEA